ncbi:MAG: tRNA (5-methylaminomethyl-2-thiouridine)(34)-methyltransferase MnmD [Roseovarius sp.]
MTRQADSGAQIEWRGAVPVSRRFADPYFSLEDGLAETRHVFLAGNGLPARLAPGFAIAELGFGTGLNLLATLQLWRDSRVPGRLFYTAFEAFALPPAQMLRAQRAFPELAALADELAPFWGRTRIELADLSLRLIEGDARVTLPAWRGRADAWYLDGFAPARNPELWEPPLLEAVFARTVPGGSAATYTAAGAVRRALAAAGFDVVRRPGHGRKRHMTVARRPLP